MITWDSKRNCFLINIPEMKYLLILFKISLIRINDSLQLMLALFWSYQSQWKFCCWFAWKKGQAWQTDSFALPCRHANQWQNSFLYCSWHLARFVLLRFCNSWYAVSMITLNYTRCLVKDSELPTAQSSNKYLLRSHIDFSL